MATGTRTRSRDLTLALIGAVLLVAAIVLVGRFDAPAGTVDDDGRLEIVLEDYAFATDELAVPAGEAVTLVIVNRDEVSHPLTFGRELEEVDGRPAGYSELLFTGLDPRITPASAGRNVDQSGTIEVRGEETVTVEVTFPPERAGTWSVGCFLGRGCHYEAGLEATLTVTD
jgi:plastocyanin